MRSNQGPLGATAGISLTKARTRLRMRSKNHHTHLRISICAKLHPTTGGTQSVSRWWCCKSSILNAFLNDSREGLRPSLFLPIDLQIGLKSGAITSRLLECSCRAYIYLNISVHTGSGLFFNQPGHPFHLLQKACSLFPKPASRSVDPSNKHRSNSLHKS